jgi:hypothetical protein
MTTSPVTAYHVFRTDGSEVLNGDTIVTVHRNKYTFLCCLDPHKIHVRKDGEALARDVPATVFRLRIEANST